MMDYSVRTSMERGHFDHGWLKTFHTFSFGEYQDPRFMGFRTLRVINEDTVEVGEGFPMHAHRNMEIVTLVLKGELAHKDSLGSASSIHANEIQLMHAGTGITHSEFNASKSNDVHLLQIWILPDTQNVKPGYEQKKLKVQENEWELLVSKNGKDDSLVIHQDVAVSLITITKPLKLTIQENRHGWLQVVSGKLSLDQTKLVAGDGVAIQSSTRALLNPETEAKLLFFDLN